MKKKIWFVIMSFLIAMMGYYGTCRKGKMESALLMENVEALAGGEGHVPMHCVGFGTVDCPINHVKVKMVLTGYGLE